MRRAGAQRDDREVEEDPQAESKAVVHVGLVQAIPQAEPNGVGAEGQQREPRSRRSRNVLPLLRSRPRGIQR